MRYKGYADNYLAELFDLPIQMINCEHNKTDGRIKHSEELKLLCVKLCTEQPNLKADFAKGYNVTDRTIRQWIVDYKQNENN